MVIAALTQVQQEWLLALAVPAMAFFSTVLTGASVIAAYSSERRVAKRRLKDLSGQEAQHAGGGGAAASVLSRIGKGHKASEGLRQWLANAGYHAASAPAVYLGAKQVLLLVGLLGAAGLLYTSSLSMQTRIMASAGAGVAMFFLPNAFIWKRRQDRIAQMRRHLPDAVDLLEICVASGMGMDMAWNCVAGEVRKVSVPLGDEMALTNMEMLLGAPRSRALRNMARRTGVQELSSMVSLLVQADRFGTSVGEALRSFAASMREDRSLRAHENAEKMAVKLLLPMVLFIFPSVLVVLVGPAAIRMWHAFNI